ncbi:hypothetical protein LCGC14_0295400 [marine sediment metagenome]|uniref:Uncharacterized protein n=1 Tax=marine sediment metagenome TaxID=412755 RepID=A0A0F9U974_9ZZZZ
MQNPFRRKRSIEEWEQLIGIKILDPDGFDRKDRHLYERKFTRSEFKAGALASTCLWPREFLDGSMRW